MAKDIKVLIIDDSALVRKLLTEILNSAKGIEVVGSASDPFVAREKIKKLNPDVLTLDVEMPKMDGLTFLENLMRLRPMPVVMVSTLTQKGADTTLQALELGAIDFVSKPKIDLSHTIDAYAEEIIEKVRVASEARVRPLERRIVEKKPKPEEKKRASAILGVDPKYSADVIIEKSGPKRHLRTTERIIAIGASTGGTEAIREVLMGMPGDGPAVVISQHIPEAFSAPFAARVNSQVEMQVFEAKDGQQILPGHAYIAPGDSHLLVMRDGARYVCRLNDGPPVNRHRPSVDVMFRSVAQNVGPNAVGVILTGMGADGALGLKEIHEAGAPTIAQDEQSSVVWGMPGEAVAMGAVDKVLPLSKVAAQVLAMARKE
ncbi:MAG: chemotaxis response regulator protein-glutamate methylesterase [Gammaproteobacteria bacterium]|nr:chemotaxis response regulator protein-glutamate methylesterase [Gammaproteobacteria bacterium]